MPDARGKLVTPVGFRPDGSLHSLLLDDQDRIQVATKPVNYDDRIGASITAISTGAGTTTSSSIAVPSSIAWVIQICMGYHNDTVSRYSYLTIHNSETSQDMLISLNSALSPYTSLNFQGQALLLPGDYISMNVASLAAGKTCQLYYWGYSFSIP